MVTGNVGTFVCLGVAFVHFRKQQDFDAALRRNRGMMGPKKVTVVKALDQDIASAQDPQSSQTDAQPRSWELKVIRTELVRKLVIRPKYSMTAYAMLTTCLRHAVFDITHL